MPTLDELNAADRDAFVAALGGVFENAPWVAERAFAKRPFATVADLCAVMASGGGRGEAEQPPSSAATRSSAARWRAPAP